MVFIVVLIPTETKRISVFGFFYSLLCNCEKNKKKTNGKWTKGDVWCDKLSLMNLHGTFCCIRFVVPWITWMWCYAWVWCWISFVFVQSIVKIRLLSVIYLVSIHGHSFYTNGNKFYFVCDLCMILQQLVGQRVTMIHMQFAIHIHVLVIVVFVF